MRHDLACDQGTFGLASSAHARCMCIYTRRCESAFAWHCRSCLLHGRLWRRCVLARNLASCHVEPTPWPGSLHYEPCVPVVSPMGSQQSAAMQFHSGQHSAASRCTLNVAASVPGMTRDVRACTVIVEGCRLDQPSCHEAC